jgi:hypothetical protein
MVVHKKDNVVVHFYNLETDKGEKHSFTLDAFHINAQLGGGENATDTFVATGQEYLSTIAFSILPLFPNF